MHPPCEMMVDSFLPAMRAMVARKLDSDGLSQGKIAGMLGLTQASVSSYLSAAGTRQLSSLQAFGVTPDQAETYASLLAEDLKNNPTYAVATLYSIWTRILGEGSACTAHRGDYPFLATCEMCLKVFSPKRSEKQDALEHVQGALRSIEGSSLFVQVMPEVSVNLAYAPDEAKSVNQVVAIPGRIVRVKGRARSFMRPEYGASTHLAAILLEVERRLPQLRAAMNLRYDPRMSKVLSKLRVSYISIGPRYPAGPQDKVLGALRARLQREDRATEPFEAVVDVGGEGVEPSLYIFAEDAIDVAHLALRIAREYSTSG